MAPDFWITVLQTFGFPVASAVVLALFAHKCITWEREKMLTTIEKNTTALEAVNRTLEHLETK